MQLLRGLQGALHLTSSTVATIGNFDGVHTGHQALLKALKAEASQQGLPTLVVLFEPQPYEYFRGASSAVRLTKFKEKWNLLSQIGIDYVCCLRFNDTLALMPAHQFATELIFGALKVKSLLIGEDFRFGKTRAGDVNLLEQVANEEGARVVVYPDFTSRDVRVSSTRTREALEACDLSLAAKLLGRAFSLSGRVVEGDKQGRTWGVPTANISLGPTALPMSGVFCVVVRHKGCDTLYQGVANLGARPTVDGTMTPRLEVHVLDFEGTLYHEELEVLFLHQLRAVQKFESLEALIQQIKADVKAARALFPQLINDFPVRVMT